MLKPTNNDFPIAEIFRQRWSPRAYSSRPVETEKLQSIFEAARWAPSSNNEQPWRFIVGRKGGDTWDGIYKTLVEWNQKWAGKAPVLILNLGKVTFTYKGRPNPTYSYDTGQAVAMMVSEAVNQGLIGHQMGGFSASTAIELFDIPDDYRPISVTAIGYYGNPDLLPEDMRRSEHEARQRLNADAFIFEDRFGHPLQWK